MFSPTKASRSITQHLLRSGATRILWSLLLLVLVLFGDKTAHAQDQLIFCNDPEKIRLPGTYADVQLREGRTYTIFFHYRNTTTAKGPLYIAFNGTNGSPLQLNLRRGFADPQADPPLAGRQAMARFLSRPETTLVGKKGTAQFSLPLSHWNVASGIMTVRPNQDTRFRIYFKHRKWTVPGMRTIIVDAPRQEVQIALTPDNMRHAYRIGVPAADMSKHFDGTYGMVYAFTVDAPAGSRVRVSFSPRGGKSGLVGIVNGMLFQSPIAPTASWKVFHEAVVGKDGKVVLTTAPFGGVFYPVEIVFQLM